MPSPVAEVPSLCPEFAEAPEVLPTVEAKHRTAAYWVKRSAAYGDPDAVLLSADAVGDHNRALQQPGEVMPFGHYDLTAPVDYAHVRKELGERFAWLSTRFAEGKYVDEKGAAVDPARFAPWDASPLANPAVATVHVALDPAQIRCAPTDVPYYTPKLDLRFNRNHCSMIRAQEPVQVLGAWPNGMKLVRTRYAYGWLSSSVRLSAAIPDAQMDAFVSGPFGTTRAPTALGPGVEVPMGTRLPLVEGAKDRVWYGAKTGFQQSGPLSSERFTPATMGLTRRGLLEAAFRYLGTPYGWGGHEGGRDCSRLVMDVLAEFGLSMPRHSRAQAHAGTFHIDIKSVESERERELLIEAAAQRGIVLLHFPGHIMLYLGQTEAGRPMALHAFAEYLVPCAERDARHPERGETLMTVDRLAVSDLELGRGTSRKAFIERISHITVLGQAPGMALQGSAEPRPAAPVDVPKRCRDSQAKAIFVSPRVPHSKGEMRFMATMSYDPGPVGLTLIDPKGQRHRPKMERMGGPPYTFVTRVETPRPGRWRAILGDGARVDACYAVRVKRRPEGKGGEAAGAWENGRQWGEATENLYGAFVESLFSHPMEQDLTWTNLQSLVQDREKNLLFDHLGQGEDAHIRLQPDCADLPYLLRAYFAWKMGLPFGFRYCNRGRTGRPPTCGKLNTNLLSRGAEGDVKAFGHFARRKVQNAVHSASGRTHPDDNGTDYYPVPLTREALRPGTLYADPHGHMLVIARWIPQTVSQYGTLLAADAQPDGTIGRRRFWRGSFLFSPETKDVGAGFKAFRPVLTDGAEVRTLRNKELVGKGGFAAFSRQQYSGTADDFYDAMAGLINPRPLDPIAMQIQLVDALFEAVNRRVVSVNNGEGFMKSRQYAPIDMPKGYSLFETTGPWEDFSTPARDMRLLISIDTVVKFADRARRAPARYGLGAGAELDAAIKRITDARDEALAKRTFTYTRSDGTPHTLSLKDITNRAKQFEMSYNPNDCAEMRWAAPPDGPEMQTCKRRAPAAQQARMKTYRAWFINRQRPPR